MIRFGFCAKIRILAFKKHGILPKRHVIHIAEYSEFYR
jgi:hypothetical protein